MNLIFQYGSREVKTLIISNLTTDEKYISGRWNIGNKKEDFFNPVCTFWKGVKYGNLPPDFSPKLFGDNPAKKIPMGIL